ncbi:MAG: hypothetical protein WD341_16130 [Tistlia sp.]|uniref:hypothetical protein n=1 Tax=Tistlia sp. TaxID=3057121 RepID=UPI0034A30B4A
MPPSAPRRLLALALAAVLSLAACGGADRPGATASEPRAEAMPLIYTPAQQVAQRYDYDAADAATRTGGEALARGDLAEARRRFEAAIEDWPLFRAAWEGLAETAERQDDAEAAARARFFLARFDWVAEIHPLAAAQAFRNLSEGRTTDSAVASPAYREQAARLVDFLQSADLANVEAANRAQPGEDFVQRYGIYVAGLVGVALIVSRFSSLFSDSDSGSD